jgi:23S rRNA (guanosine2251-2'-O)-methyltransferase
LLVVPQRRQALERIVLHATTLRIPIVEVEGGSLTAVAGFDGHQGIALVVEPRRFATLDEILARAIERGEPPFVLVLDSLEDPQNVGTLLRSAEAAGVHGIVFPTARQAPLTPAAVKASAGATEHLLLAPVDDLPAALADLHVRGLRIIGSDSEAPLTSRESDLRGAVAIVVGSEGHGLSPAVRRRSDGFVRIPMRGAIGSLNAAVAGSILLFETLGQRDPDARPDVAADATQARGRGRDRDRLELDGDADEAPASEPEAAGVPQAMTGEAADIPAAAPKRAPRASKRTAAKSAEHQEASAAEPADKPELIAPDAAAEPQASADELDVEVELLPGERADQPEPIAPKSRAKRIPAPMPRAKRPAAAPRVPRSRAPKPTE